MRPGENQGGLGAGDNDVGLKRELGSSRRQQTWLTSQGFLRCGWGSAGVRGSAGPGAGPDTCTKPGLKLVTWPGPWPAPSGVCAGGSVRLPATLPHGGACGVAAVCRRPGKDPPRQFGERAFPGFPWMPAASLPLRHLYRSRSKTARRVAPVSSCQSLAGQLKQP